MQVELAEERIFRLADRFSLEHAEGRAWAKRVEAFGALARVAGLFNQPREDDFTVIYRERRLQPFWRIAVSTATAYERRRSYAVPVGPEVRHATFDGAKRDAVDGVITFDGVETCREEARREVFVDGLSKQPAPGLAAYLQHDAIETDADTLAKATAEGMVVVPPQAKASMVVRDVVAAAIGKIDADTVTEELVRVEAVDLYYRPIHAFRYRRADKEAVVEFDAITGEARVGGATFEQYLGQALEPRFLLDVGAETLNFVVPGANLAKLIIVKGMEMKGLR